MSEADSREPRREEGVLTIMVLPEGGESARTFRLTPTRLRWLRALGIVGAVLALTLAASWIYLAYQARRVGALEAEVARLAVREERVEQLAANLEEVEAAYERLRALFGTEAGAESGELWLPPAREVGGFGGASGRAGTQVPSVWPLTEPGFVTQDLLEGARANHPGIDVAVPTGSYVRAAGGGTVVEVGDDPVYGRYLVIEHGGEYRSRYAHNSLILADSGAEVRTGEVIALSGSTGRSTAPHLHFEIQRGDSLIDPLTLVSHP